MSDDSQFTSIHQAVLDTLPELGISEPVITKMAVLTRSGYCVGHRFLFDGVQAVWLMAEGIIRFYADNGSLLKTSEVGQVPSTLCKAPGISDLPHIVNYGQLTTTS